MGCASCNCPKFFYQDWRSTFFVVNVLTPTITGTAISFSAYYPFKIMDIVTLFNVPASGPNYANAGFVTVNAATMNTYYSTLFSMYIAAMLANRDVDNPDGITSYEPLSGVQDFSGYYKRYLNNQQFDLNYYLTSVYPSYLLNFAAIRGPLGFTAVQDMDETTNLNRQQYPPIMPRNLFLPPGKYTFLLQNLAPPPTPPPIDFDWKLNTHTINITEGISPLITFSTMLYNPAFILDNYLDVTESYFWIENNINNTVYGSSSIPITGTYGLPNWDGFPNDPEGAIMSWMIEVISDITGFDPTSSDPNVFYNDGTPLANSKYCIGLNNIDGYPHQGWPCVIVNGAWNFGALNFPVPPVPADRYYKIFINFTGEEATDQTFWQPLIDVCYVGEEFDLACYNSSENPPPSPWWDFTKPIFSYFWIVEGDIATPDIYTTIYGSPTVPYDGTQPNWIEGDIDTSIASWLQAVMLELTGDPRLSSFTIIPNSECGGPAEPICTYAAGIDDYNAPPDTCGVVQYQQPAVQTAQGYDFGDLNLPNMDQNIRRYVFIQFSQELEQVTPAAPYSQGLYNFDQQFGIENLNLYVNELKPIM